MTEHQIFLSYARKDTSFRNALMLQLGVIGRDRHVYGWTDQSIKGGDSWRKAIDRAIVKAEVVVLLVSANALTSRFILDTEVAAAMAASKRLYPILVRDCAWQKVPWLSERQMRPTPLKPLNQIPSARRDTAYADIVNELDTLLR